MVQFVLFFLIIHIHFSHGIRHTFSSSHSDKNFIGPIGAPFGFLEGGVVTVRVDDATFKKHGLRDDDDSIEASLTLMRFKTEGKFATYEERLFEDDASRANDEKFSGKVKRPISYEDCPPNRKNAITSIKLNLKGSPNKQEGGNSASSISMEHEFTRDEEGLYFLVYAICHAKSSEDSKGDKDNGEGMKILSSLHLNISMHNVDPRNGRQNYLTAGDIPLPTMYFLYGILYSILAYKWVKYLRSTAESAQVYQIHHLMTILIILKTFSLLSDSARYHYIRVTGSGEMWTVVYYGFEFLKGTMLFLVILLLGSGWSMFKPFLTNREKKLMCVVFMLQILDNVAVVVLLNHMEGEAIYSKWVGLLHMFDILCCGAVIVPVVWQIGNLEEKAGILPSDQEQDDSKNEVDDDLKDLIEDESIDPSHGNSDDEYDQARKQKTLGKLKVFKSFYISVVVYIYFTRIVVFLFSSMLDYHQGWMRQLLYEFGTLVFYIYTGYKFCPTTPDQAVPYVELRSTSNVITSKEDKHGKEKQHSNRLVSDATLRVSKDAAYI